MFIIADQISGYVFIKVIKKIMEYDPGNKKLKNLISSITND